MADDAPVEITWPYAFDFGRTVTTPSGDLDSLTLREPNTADALEFGLIDGTVSSDGWIGLIAKLSGKAVPVIKALPYVESMRLVNRLSGFFTAAVKA